MCYHFPMKRTKENNMRSPTDILSCTDFGFKTLEHGILFEIEPMQINWLAIVLVVLISSIVISISPLPLKIAALILLIAISS